MTENQCPFRVVYVITTFLISAIVYMLINSNLEKSFKLARLRDDVDEITHLIMQKSAMKTDGDSTRVSDFIDERIKKRLSGVVDDIYTLKKDVKAKECASVMESLKPKLVGGGGGGGGKSGTSLKDERINYASEDLGAKIINVQAEPISDSNIVKNFLQLEFSSNPPIYMIRQVMDPGNCFGFRKNVSLVSVKLAKFIKIESIELEHITKKLSPTGETSSAPKDFEVYGLSADWDQPVLLGYFTYDNLPNKRIQIYNVKSTARFLHVRFKFKTNHGHPEYTCVYRVAVFGAI